MKNKFLPWISVVACLSVFPQALAEGLPDLGDTAQSSFSPAQEREMGEKFMREYRFNDPSFVDDAEVEAYLNRLGRRLLAKHPEAQRFEFFALRNSMINAFAMPGGYIGVHTGLILTAQNESELASVLSHEIGHVEQHHIARMAQEQGKTTMYLLASMLLAVLASQSRTESGGQIAEAAAMAGQAAVIQSQLSYSRNYEREADRFGMQMLADSGLDPQGMVAFFERMQRNTRVYENNAPAYLRTHPLTTERIADMAARLQTNHYRQVPNSLDFLLVQAKLDVSQGAPHEALQRALAKSHGDGKESLVRSYALTRAYLRLNNLSQAEKNLQEVRQSKLESSMLPVLAADVALAQNQGDRAAKICAAARATYADAKPLVYCEAEADLAANKAQPAIQLLRDQVTLYTQDFRLRTLLAKAYAMAGKRALQHSAQAEAYVLQGTLPAAIEQLELAQRAGDANFYEASVIDARVRELKARQKEAMADKKHS